MKFTDAAIRALKPREERYIEWGEGSPGFGLRVSPQGRKSWVFMYRFDGKARMMTLGAFPAMTLSAARKAYATAFETVEQGEDPGASAVQKKKEERDSPTIAQLADDYIERWAKIRKRSWTADRRALDYDVIPAWGKRKAKEITRRDVLDLLDDIANRGAPIQANRTLALISRMFNWAIERAILDVNPCFRVKAPAPEKKKDRVLSADEIKTFWRAFQDESLPVKPIVRLIIQMILITAQRKGEVVLMRWADIDRAEKIWTIPAEVAKNGRVHRVPLSDLALSLIDQAAEIVSKGETRPLNDYVFKSPRGEGPCDPAAIARAVARNQAVLGADFTPHDLRRTAATHMTGMGVPRLTVSKILNHTEQEVTAIYDRYAYDSEKRQALESWAARLSEIVGEDVPASNVVPLRPAVG